MTFPSWALIIGGPLRPFEHPGACMVITKLELMMLHSHSPTKPTAGPEEEASREFKFGCIIWFVVHGSPCPMARAISMATSEFWPSLKRARFGPGSPKFAPRIDVGTATYSGSADGAVEACGTCLASDGDDGGGRRGPTSSSADGCRPAGRCAALHAQVCWGWDGTLRGGCLARN
jgi:hypothetical protein